MGKYIWPVILILTGIAMVIILKQMAKKGMNPSEFTKRVLVMIPSVLIALGVSILLVKAIN